MNQEMSSGALAPSTAGRVNVCWRQVMTYGLVALLTSVVATMWIIGEVIPPLVIMGAVIGVLSAVAGKWGYKWPVAFVTAVLALAFVGLNLPFVMEDLGHPETFFSFFPTVVMLVLAGVVAVAGVANGMRLSTAAIVPGIATLGVAVAGAGILSLVATAGVDSDARQAGDVVVTAQSTEFPEVLEASAGTTWFYIDNKDRVRHTFVIEGQDYKVELPGSTARRLEVSLPAGTYRFYCDVPGHDVLMEGELKVS